MPEPKEPVATGLQAESPEAGGAKEPTGAGWVWAMLAFNALVMGVVALSFASGPYSSWGQELGYRYGSLGFLAAGALLPALALPFVARRSPSMVLALAAWAILAFLAFGHYVSIAGGGV